MQLPFDSRNGSRQTSPPPLSLECTFCPSFPQWGLFQRCSLERVNVYTTGQCARLNPAHLSSGYATEPSLSPLYKILRFQWSGAKICFPKTSLLRESPAYQVSDFSIWCGLRLSSISPSLWAREPAIKPTSPRPSSSNCLCPPPSLRHCPVKARGRPLWSSWKAASDALTANWIDF